MPDVLYLFRISRLRRYGRIALFAGKWVARLLSASVEVYLHGNFGRRYFTSLIGAFLLYIICANLLPRPNVLTNVFLIGLFVRIVYHAIQVFHRRRLSAPEPHTFSTGVPWNLWQQFGIQRTTTQRYLEPLICWLVALLVSTQDPFLGLWLKASAIALFIKEQFERITSTRRILDSIDGRLEAQALNASLKQNQPQPGQGAQRSHRAHFPQGGRHPHP